MEYNIMYLFLKASNYSKSSRDPTEIGECYMCQRVRMIVRLKGVWKDSEDDEDDKWKGIKDDEDDKYYKVKEVFVDPRNKQNHPLFKDIDATMLPVLLHEGKEYDDAEQIEAHLEKHFKGTSLDSANGEANKLAHQRSPISDFNKWVKADDDKNSHKHGVKIARFLHDIDNHLKQNEGKGPFLDGDTPKIPDCILLPKLYHMRVVADYVSSSHDPVDIFEKFSFLSNYMRKAQEIESSYFSSTLPPLDEITFKWKDKKGKKSEASMKQLTEF